jgi:CRISPR/Cas system-associated endonuclease Cas1
MLNYGYTILRAAVSRALIGSGLYPAFGVFHRSRYNAFPLADDVMEPYRPFVKESQAVHIKRVKSIVPETGMVSILSVTDKQYGDIVNFWGKEKSKKVPTDPLQLEFF